MAAEKGTWEAVQEIVDEYLDGYEMTGETEDGRDCCYTPTDQEQLLLTDAVAGLIADGDFCQAIYAATKQLRELRTEQGCCAGCGHLLGGHWGQCSECSQLETSADTAPAIGCYDCAASLFGKCDQHR
jgi:hypothetical protein